MEWDVIKSLTKVIEISERFYKRALIYSLSPRVQV